MGRALRLVGDLRSWVAQRLAPKDDVESWAELAEWSKTPLGRTLLADQQAQMDSVLDCVFGYHLMTMGAFDMPPLCRESKINHKFYLSPHLDSANSHRGGSSSCVQSCFESLPLASESIDVAVLHHALDYSQNPHQVLREAARALIPRGYLIVVGFNPWSLQGATKFFRQWWGGSFWRRHSLRAGRLQDWLRLLDCEPLLLERGFYRLPVASPWVLSRFSFLEAWAGYCGLPFGGYYLLVARKDVVGMTPIKASWKPMKPVVGLVMGKPSAPQGRHVKGEELASKPHTRKR